MMSASNRTPHTGARKRQNGGGFLLIVALLGTMTMTGLSVFLDSRSIQLGREAGAGPTLMTAKEALLGHAAIAGQGYLPLPHIGTFGGAVQEGASTPHANWSQNDERFAVVGMLPWRTLGLPDLRDSQQNCLWYAVAGRFKQDPPGRPLNWDSWQHDGYAYRSGRLRLASSDGSLPTPPVFYAALVIAPGKALGFAASGQTRQRDMAETNPVCQGNYQARNYLDPPDPALAPGGVVNYFAAAANQRLAPDDGDQTFLLSPNTDHVNDRILAITADEVFDVTLQSYLSRFMLDPQFATMPIAGPKGVDHLDCSAHANPEICASWRDHLLLTALPAPAPITIDGSATGNCSRVLIFGGQAAGTQTRATAADRDAPANYLEAANQAAFAVPVAANHAFSGFARYAATNRSRDVMRCIP